MPTLMLALPQEAQTRLRRLAVVGQAPGLAERPSAPVTKFDVETTLKDARYVIGLTPAEVMLLDVLLALTPEADWLEGPPLVFASNRTICQRSSFCDRHVSRLLASLETKGVVLRHYSGNGKRWGLRGADDALVDGRGVDLSPMIARVPACPPGGRLWPSSMRSRRHMPIAPAPSPSGGCDCARPSKPSWVRISMRRQACYSQTSIRPCLLPCEPRELYGRWRATSFASWSDD